MTASQAATAPPVMEKRRLNLLESALVVFARKGFHDTRIDDVCAAAGISRATFYRYFDRKEALFDALVDLMGVEVIEIGQRLDPVTPDAAGLATMRKWIDLLLANTERWGPVVGEIIRPRDEHAAARNQAIFATTKFAETLGNRFCEGGVKDISPQMAALAIIAMVERVASQVRIWNIDVDRETVTQALAVLALKMLHPGVVLGFDGG
jgi:AcrR family transcriptional regulator